MNLIPATFQIDCEGPAFPGLHDPSIRWNGWACPHFDRATVEQIIAMATAEGDITFRWDGDTLVMIEECYGDEETAVTPDADGRYALGAFGWVWTDV